MNELKSQLEEEKYHIQIRQACESGHPRLLKNWLAETSVENVRTFLQVHLEGGATPLILACKNGHLDLIKFMVEQCGVDISQTGSVKFDGEDIEGAPPLWCAAAAGHIEIVRYLIKKGASINKTTRTNSTPLRAACYDGHLDVVTFLVEHNADIEIANRHGHTCLMIACYRGHTPVVKYLLQHSAEINRQSIKGNTALHDAAESGKLEIVKILLRKKAIISKDAYGQTPMSAAAMTGHKEIVDFFMDLEGDKFPADEQASAMELLGATYVDKLHDHTAAVNIWVKALGLRKKAGQAKKVNNKQVAAYDNAEEVTTEDECHALLRDPDMIRMQALLIRERVLGPSHPETGFCIRYRGALYADGGDFERCLSLWLYTLETQATWLDPMADATMSSIVSFVELFAYVFVKGVEKVGGESRREGFVETALRVLEVTVEEVGRYKTVMHDRRRDGKAHDIQKLLVALLHIVSLVNYVPSLSFASSSPNTIRLQKMLYNAVKMQVRTPEGATLLHLACTQDTSNYMGRIRVSTFPSLSVARLLLKVGADPDARDNQRRTPLHMVCLGEHVHVPLVGALLAGGAHADICDDHHVSPLVRLKDRGRGRDVCPVANTTLKCLAARTIAHSKRLTPDLYRGFLGKDLEDFIDLH